MRDLNTLNDAALQAGPDDAEGAEMTDQAKPVGPCTNCGAPVVNGSVHSECPASPAAKPAEVPVVAWWVQAGPGMSRLAWLPGYPTQMHSEDALMLKSAHLAAMEALRRSQTAALVELTVECERWAKEVAARDARIADLTTRMDRARNILTNGNPRPECNWGMLDTSQPTEQPSAIPVGGSLVHPDDAARAGAAIGDNFDPMR